MSKNRYSIEYKCECEQSYSTVCGKKSVFVLVEFNSTDTYGIFHKHHDNQFAPYTLEGYLSSSELNALRNLLNKNAEAGVIEGTPESYHTWEGAK